jgi:large subunit ribosomal protein L23
MADITDIKSILYTEKTIELQEKNIVVVQTTTRMTKNKLKEVFKEYFGIDTKKINSLRQSGKVKRFKGKLGSRPDFKKFYVTIPEGAQIANISA